MPLPAGCDPGLSRLRRLRVLPPGDNVIKHFFFITIAIDAYLQNFLKYGLKRVLKILRYMNFKRFCSFMFKRNILDSSTKFPERYAIIKIMKK